MQNLFEKLQNNYGENGDFRGKGVGGCQNNFGENDKNRKKL